MIDDVTEEFFDARTLEWESRTNHPYRENDVLRKDGMAFVARRAAWLEPPGGFEDGVMWVLIPVRDLDPEDFTALCRQLAEAG